MPNVVGPMPTEFPVTLGLHKGSALSHVLFVVLLLVSGPTPNKALFKELVAPPWGL